MRLNHVNLCSSDVDTLADTLVTHFGFRQLDAGEYPRPDGSGTPRYACVIGPDQSELVITQVPPASDGQSIYPKGFHFGYIQDTREAVLAKHEQLAAAGLNPGELHDGFEVWGATWSAFSCPLGDGLEIEINYRTHSALLDRTDNTLE